MQVIVQARGQGELAQLWKRVHSHGQMAQVTHSVGDTRHRQYKVRHGAGDTRRHTMWAIRGTTRYRQNIVQVTQRNRQYGRRDSMGDGQRNRQPDLEC